MTKDLSLIRNAFTYPFIGDGVPILYYGDEQGFSGASDPVNREPFWGTRYDTSGTNYALFKMLNSARKQAGLASGGSFFWTQSKVVQITQHEIVISKPPMLSILSNGGATYSGSVTVPSNASLPISGVIVDVLTCTSWKTDGSGKSVVSISGGKPQVILPLSALGNLCPGGVTQSTITKGA